MQVLFDLRALSIEDSLRSEGQRDIARTPPGETRKLIHVAYAGMYSALSPLYKQHATEVVVEFAQVGVNFDVDTIMHLRPFLAILLQRRSPPPAPVDSSDSAGHKQQSRPDGLGGIGMGMGKNGGVFGVDFSSTRSSSVASLSSADPEQQGL